MVMYEVLGGTFLQKGAEVKVAELGSTVKVSCHYFLVLDKNMCTKRMEDGSNVKCLLGHGGNSSPDSGLFCRRDGCEDGGREIIKCPLKFFNSYDQELVETFR